jgi:hypothetical protein
LGKVLRGVQTLEDLIEVAERELGEIVVEWRALLRMLGVDPRKARYIPGESTQAWRDLDGNWYFSVDPWEGLLSRAGEGVLYELARAYYRGKRYSALEVELLSALARWLAMMMPDSPPNPERVLKPTREEVKRAVELARAAGVELDEELARLFERKPQLAALWALTTFLYKLLGLEDREAVPAERFLFYLAKAAGSGGARPSFPARLRGFLRRPPRRGAETG